MKNNKYKPVNEVFSLYTCKGSNAPDPIDIVNTDRKIRNSAWPCLPENPTNGDMIKAMFPNDNEGIIKEGTPCVYYGRKMTFSTEWWNAPYKREVKDAEID